MIKTLLSLILSFGAIYSFAQNDKNHPITSTRQSDTTVTYRLFPTQNIWIFIKLNTRTGQMWQVQFNMKSDNRFITKLSSEVLVTQEEEINGRFTLYPTQNMYTFILLDQLDGRTWQVQWSTDPSNKGIVPIE